MSGHIPALCRDAAMFGASFWLQSSLVLVVALLAARFLARRSIVRNEIYRAALAAVILLPLLSLAPARLHVSVPVVLVSPAVSSVTVRGVSPKFERDSATRLAAIGFSDFRKWKG